MNSPQTRLEMALQQTMPSRATYELARTLRDDGMTQLEMYRLFDEFRAAHESDADETVYNAVVETMDGISGWCGPSFRLFDADLPPRPTNSPP